MDLNFDADINQQVPTLRSYLNNRKVVNVNLSMDGNANQLKKSNRHRMNKDTALHVNLFEKTANETETRLHLSDVENWILYVLHLNVINMIANVYKAGTITILCTLKNRIQTIHLLSLKCC